MKLLLLLTILALQALSTPVSSAWSPLAAIESELLSRQNCNLVVASSDVAAEYENNSNNNEEQGEAAEEEEPDCD